MPGNRGDGWVVKSVSDDNVDRLFDYSLRVSHRAKHAKLLIKPYGGLEVVIPRRFPKHAIAGLLLKHRDWITRQLEKRPLHNPEPDLPEHIYLSIDDSYTDIIYKAEPAGRNNPSELVVESGNYRESISQLRCWVRRVAWQRLPSMLDKLAQHTGLEYRKVTIRSQKTRWGSCSSSGTISLNDQLLFVSHDTTEYLMIHELCHRRYPNHSADFWRLVERITIDH